MIIDWGSIPEAAGMRAGAARRTVAGERSSVTHVVTASTASFDGRVHRHDHEQWLVMLEGRLELLADGDRYWVVPGDVVIFRRNTWHGAVGVGEEGARYLEIFAPARIDQLPGYVGGAALEWS
jgi:quercetin dioxygenase-like cupin family protein